MQKTFPRTFIWRCKWKQRNQSKREEYPSQYGHLIDHHGSGKFFPCYALIKSIHENGWTGLDSLPLSALSNREIFGYWMNGNILMGRSSLKPIEENHSHNKKSHDGSVWFKFFRGFAVEVCDTGRPTIKQKSENYPMVIAGTMVEDRTKPGRGLNMLV